MAYTKVDYTDVEPAADGMHFLQDPLNAEQLGITVVECEPGWSSKEHDHADDGQEEVYFLVDGAAVVTVDGEEVPMESGDAVRIPPEATRLIENGDTESTFVLASAP